MFKVELQMGREVEEEKKVFIVICFDGIVSTFYFCCCFFSLFLLKTKNQKQPGSEDGGEWEFQ